MTGIEIFDMVLSIISLIAASFSLWYSYKARKQLDYTASLQDTMKNIDFSDLNFDRTELPAPPAHNKKLFTFVPRKEKFKSFGR